MTTNSAPVTDTAPASTSSTDTGQSTTTTETNPAPAATEGQQPATPQNKDGQPSTEGTPNADDTNKSPTGEATFQVPDAYKDQPWASKVKSADDLWKQLANAQTLIGRKQAVPDFDKATPQEIEQYLSYTRPATPEAYQFDQEEGYNPSGLEPEFAKAFHKAGLHPTIGNSLIKDLQGVLKAGAEKAFDADDFLNGMEKTFGNGYEAKVEQTRQVIEANLAKDDKAALEGVPNKYLTLMYKLANNMAKAYGATESGIQGEHKAGNLVQPNIDEVRKGLREQLKAIDKRPHTASEKETLINKLNDTYKNQTNKR